MTTFSVIIPHRDSIRTLVRAVNSVPDLPNVEVIIVDNSLKAINKDDLKRINRNFSLFFSSPEKGAGCARNVGMQNAKGQFLLFMDADDFFSEEISSVLYTFEENNYYKYDITFFRCRGAISEDLSPCSRGSQYMEYFDKYRNEKSSSNLNYIRFYYTVPWGKIYKKPFLDEYKIKFDEVPASNDIMFTTKAAVKANNMCVDDRVIYVVTVSSSSLTRTKSSRNLRSRFSVYIVHNAYLKRNGHSKYCIDLIRPLANLFKISVKDGIWGITQLFEKNANILDAVYKYIK